MKTATDEPTFMGLSQSELCERMDAFLKAEIEKNRRFIAEKQRQARKLCAVR